MGTISYTIPTAGSTLNSVADPQISTALQTLLTAFNGDIDAVNLSALLAQSSGVNQSGQVVKGVSVNAGPGTRTNTAYGALSDAADQVTGLVVPANGLIRVWYQALWQESVGRAARAAIFVGANQLKVQASATGPVTEAAATNVAVTNQATALTSCPIGLASGNSGNTIPGDVTTGQAVGYFIGSGTSAAGLVVEIGGTVIDPTGLGFGGGPCDIMKLPAGTYNISVQYKASSGTVTSSGRLLIAQVISPT